MIINLLRSRLFLLILVLASTVLLSVVAGEPTTLERTFLDADTSIDAFKRPENTDEKSHSLTDNFEKLENPESNIAEKISDEPKILENTSEKNNAEKVTTEGAIEDSGTPKDSIEMPEALLSKPGKIEVIKAKFKGAVEGIRKSRICKNKYFWPGAIAAGTLFGVGGTACVVSCLRGKKAPKPDSNPNPNPANGGKAPDIDIEKIPDLGSVDWNSTFVERQAAYEQSQTDACQILACKDHSSLDFSTLDGTFDGAIFCQYREIPENPRPTPWLQIKYVDRNVKMVELQQQDSTLNVLRGPGKGSLVACFVEELVDQVCEDGLDCQIDLGCVKAPFCGNFYAFPKPMTFNAFFLYYTIFLFKCVLNADYLSHAVFFTIPNINSYSSNSYETVVNCACGAIHKLFKSTFNDLAKKGFIFSDAPKKKLEMTIEQFFRFYNIKTYVLLPNDLDLLAICRNADKKSIYINALEALCNTL